jgi:hypothetical protein
VRNAQRSGAAGVIIADNTCLCTDDNCMKVSSASTYESVVTKSGTVVTKLKDGMTPLTCETREPIMADDGSGGDITIPSMLMFKVDADLVKDELMANRQVQIEMAWSLPTNRVEYDLWMTPSEKHSGDFIKNFKTIAVALRDKAYFTPHMYIHDGVRLGCRGNQPDSSCGNMCTNDGRYCATATHNGLILGSDVVKESLRRICIWHNYGAVNGIGIEWWDYITAFIEHCDNQEQYTNPSCIENAYTHAKVDGILIDRCMIDSGTMDSTERNTKLDSVLVSQERHIPVVIPTILVNGAVRQGSLTVKNVFTSICSAYSEGATPEVCMNCMSCPDIVRCVSTGQCSASCDANEKSHRRHIYEIFLSRKPFLGRKTIED